MTTKHKLVATIPHGPKDLGAEIECAIAFSFLPGGKPSSDDPGWGPEIEFISAAPIRPFLEYEAMQQESLDELAAEWLASDEGQAAAVEEVAAELQEARVFIAEIRRES